MAGCVDHDGSRVPLQITTGDPVTGNESKGSGWERAWAWRVVVKIEVAMEVRRMVDEEDWGKGRGHDDSRGRVRVCLAAVFLITLFVYLSLGLCAILRTSSPTMGRRA